MAGLAKPGQQTPNSYFGMAYAPMSTTDTMTGNTRIAGQQPDGSISYSPQNMYNSSLPQSARDYDRIMQGYQGVMNRARAGNPNTGNLRNTINTELSRGPIESSNVQYNPTADVTGALKTLQGYSQDGGYTDADVADLRARGISPIRSVYANAERNLKRQRSLQGGYAPGMAAATTRMAREMSQQLADRVTDVNASIASQRAAGRRDMAGAYGNLASSESGRFLETDTRNADRRLDAARTNAGVRTSLLNNLSQVEELEGRPQREALAALEGMRGLYGTTPAQPALYGSQAFNATRNAQEQQQQGFNNRMTTQNFRRAYTGGMGR